MEKNKFLIANSTREERIKYISDAIAISTLDAKEPTTFGKALYKKYIDGEMELSEIRERIIEHYKQFGES